MKNIFKFLLMALMVPLFLQSCREDDFTMQSPEPSFELYSTTLSSSVLYPTMADNTFRLAWDNSLSNASEYTVHISATEDFASPVTLGTSSSTNFTTTIGDLNEALIQAGFAPYRAQKVYIKVTSGANTSNVINFDVTPYPSAKPVITSPSAGASIVLSGELPLDIATTISWSDYEYGTDVSYLVEVAKKGSTDFAAVGTVDNETSLEVRHNVLNDTVLKLGLMAGVATEVDLRVTATTKSVGGTITAVSTPVTISVTPYVAFKDLFLVGEAVAAGWSSNNNNQALFRDPINTNKFYFTGYFNSGGFKVLETLGVDTWSSQWGVRGTGIGTVDATGDPDTFVIPAAGYYTFEMDIVAKTYSITPYTGSTATTYNRIGLIGGFTEWGSDVALTKSTFDPHQWTLYDVELPVGEVKFRAENGWDTSWGGATEISGVATLQGPNINVSQAGIYDVYFNDLTGAYLLIKK